MGRKIPGKKQRKIKDLAKVIKQRDDLMRSKVNAPPPNPDEQDVPKSMKEFIQLTKIAETEKNIKFSGSKKSSIVAKPNVTTKHSFFRGSSEQLEVKKESTKTYVSKIKAKNRKKVEKLRMKKKIKAQKLKEEQNEDEDAYKLEVQKDVIRFGEVVHKPPEISVRPRKVALSGLEHRPGRKDDLLLKSLLSGEKRQEPKHKNLLRSEKSQFARKQKDMTVADRRQLEYERQRAMLAYRDVVKNRNKRN